MLISFDEYDFLIGVGVLLALLPVVWRWKHNRAYLFFFSIFWVYLLAVVQVVFFPLAINLDASPAMPSVNLIPFYFGGCSMPDVCARDIVENILLTVPFGFGINFLARVKPQNFLWLAPAVGLGFELSQLVISLVLRSGLRAVDVNDVIFNATGALLGYALFRVFAWAYLKATAYFHIGHTGLLGSIYDVVS